MNAALSPCTLQGSHSWLVALTTANPTAGDLRLRAAFWREYLGREHAAIADPQVRAVYANCVEMLALADRMDKPAPVVTLIPKRKPAKVSAIGAEQFWTLHSQAVRGMVARHGLSWRNDRPEETIEVTLPARLCSYLGPLGGRIKWCRDHRMPAPSYWPGGALPDGVEALPVAPRYDGPMGDDHPSLVMIREVIAEQAMNERLRRGRTAIVAHWRAQHRSALFGGYTSPSRNVKRLAKLGNVRLAGNCRRAMLAELARLEENKAFSPSFPRMER